MRRTGQKIVALLLLVATSSGMASDNCCCVTSHLSYRSQGEDSARELAGGIIKHIYIHDTHAFNSNVSIAPGYTKSFRATDIARSLFDCALQGCDCRSLYVRGGSVTDRDDNKDMLGFWFYLPDNFKSSICFRPEISNTLVNLSLYLGFDEWVQGLYLSIHTPITHTKWDLNAYEYKATTSTSSWKSGITTPLTSFFDYACNKKTPAVSSTNSYQSLRYNKICPCSQKRTGLADIHADLGWNYSKPTWHVGGFARTVIPTGNRPTGEYLFEPMIGNGKHWELGLGLTGHGTLFDWADQNRIVTVHAAAHLTHLFKTKQYRAFDLKKNGPLSRYMLASRDVSETLVEWAPVANLTRCTVDVSVGAQADFLAMINYFHNNFTLDAGYNLWVRSCEKFKCPTCDCCNSSGSELDGETWSIGENDTIFDASTDDDTYAISTSDLNMVGTKGLSQKLFTSFGYHWLGDFARAVPYLAFGIEVEIGSKHGSSSHDTCCSSSCNSNCCSSCKNCCTASLSQWGFWLKSGVSF